MVTPKREVGIVKRRREALRRDKEPEARSEARVTATNCSI